MVSGILLLFLLLLLLFLLFLLLLQGYDFGISGFCCESRHQADVKDRIGFTSWRSIRAEASYLCVTGPYYPLTSFCSLSAFLVITLRSLENRRFHQQLSLSTVPMSSGDM